MSDGYWNVVERVWDDISIYDGADRFHKEYYAAPEHPRILFAAHWAQSEIMNGGLGQFYSNSTGVLAPEAVVAFKALGMLDCAMILLESMSFFGVAYLREQADREEVFERFYDEHGDDAIPLLEYEDAMAELLETDNGGFELSADQYAKNLG